MMELVLNLAWLLLALPAIYLWRSARLSHARRKPSSLQCLLALGCVLVVLFPVISATDDLHAMRPEMEESSASKRSLRQASHDKNSLWNSGIAAQPAILAEYFPLVFQAGCGSVVLESVPSFSAPPVTRCSGRAPPLTFS